MIGPLKGRPLWQAASGLMVAFTLYWGVFADDRYVSEAHVVVENVQAPSRSLGIASFLSGNAAAKENMLLRDYLLSTDMLRKLDAAHDLRGHWHDSYDIFSRLIAKDVSPEWLLRHYRSRVSIDYDDYSGLLNIRVQAYTPQKAQAVARSLVEGGEQFINELAQKIAAEQVAFVEKDVAMARERMARARQLVLAHQNASGLVSPVATVTSMSGTIARLEDEIATARARKRALEAYLTPAAAELVQANAQLRALEDQIAAERARLVSPNRSKTLNRVAEEHERLLLEASFEQDVYKSALASLEVSRVEASRTLKKVAVVQTPTLPERSEEPRRIYNIAVYLLGTLLLAGLLHLVIVIIREHKD